MANMTPEMSDVLARAKQLSAHERELLIDRLVESLDQDPAEQGVAEAWDQEIKSRVDEIRSGKAKMIPGEEVERELAARMRRARK
jgi:putative addiction module component (TIGR02574 family)